MLLGAIGDRAHRFTGPLVVHIDVGAHPGIRVALLFVRIESIVIALVLARDVIRQFIELQPLPPHLIFINGRAKAREDRVPIVIGIVDRYSRMILVIGIAESIEVSRNSLP